jgi:hypothetical protein
LATDRWNLRFSIADLRLREHKIANRKLKIANKSGSGTEIRTPNFLLNRQALSPIELSRNKIKNLCFTTNPQSQIHNPKSVWRANAAKNLLRRTKDKCVRCEQKTGLDCIPSSSQIFRRACFVEGNVAVLKMYSGQQDSNLQSRGNLPLISGISRLFCRLNYAPHRILDFGFLILD